MRISRVVGVTLNVQAEYRVAVTRHSVLHTARRQSDLLQSCASVKSVDLSNRVIPPAERNLVGRMWVMTSLLSNRHRKSLVQE